MRRIDAINGLCNARKRGERSILCHRIDRLTAKIQRRRNRGVEVAKLTRRDNPHFAIGIGHHDVVASEEQPRRCRGKWNGVKNSRRGRINDVRFAIALVQDDDGGALLQDTKLGAGRLHNCVEFHDFDIRATDDLFPAVCHPHCGIVEHELLCRKTARNNGNGRNERGDQRAARQRCDQ